MVVLFLPIQVSDPEVMELVEFDKDLMQFRLKKNQINPKSNYRGSWIIFLRQ